MKLFALFTDLAQRRTEEAEAKNLMRLVEILDLVEALRALDQSTKH